MLDPEKQKILDEIQRNLKILTNATLVLVTSGFVLVYFMVTSPSKSGKKVTITAVQVEEELPEFENGIHVRTGFKEDANLNLVIANCTSCHSAKMVTQNRATREGWQTMIRWMQETQNLWDLGESEGPILDYLAKYYAPEEQGRRQPLTDIAWYELED